MDTGLSNDSLDLIISNHVLEHVQNDIKSLKELLRVVGMEGVLHITVPTPTYRWQTVDWGFPDPKIAGHYRDYGADFPQNVIHNIDGLEAASVVGFDPVTGAGDLVYFFSFSREKLALLGNLWKKNQVPVTRVYSANK